MKLNNTKFLLSMIMLSVSFIGLAQPVDPPADSEVPINNYVILLGIIGVLFAFNFLSKSLVKAK